MRRSVARRSRRAEAAKRARLETLRQERHRRRPEAAFDYPALWTLLSVEERLRTRSRLAIRRYLDIDVVREESLERGGSIRPNRIAEGLEAAISGQELELRYNMMARAHRQKWKGRLSGLWTGQTKFGAPLTDRVADHRPGIDRDPIRYRPR